MNSRSAISTTILLEFIIVLFAFLFDGFTLEALQTSTRFSGRLSLIIFSLIFLLNNKPEKLRSFLSAEFYLVFAVAHGIHLIELLSFVVFSGNKLIPVRLAGGFVAYLLIFLMPIAQYLQRKNGIQAKSFNLFSRFYLYYVWFIFFMTYLPRIMGTLQNVGGKYFEFVIFFSWIIVMLGIKITQIFKISPLRNQ